MLVLSALCVLLPLAAALDTCDTSTTNFFLAQKKLNGGPIRYFSGNYYYFAATETKATNTNVYSVAVKFEEAIENSVVVHFLYRSSYGNQTDYQSSTYDFKDDHISVEEKSLSVYFFPCSNNLIAGYRCANTGSTGSGPNYFILAVWDKTEAEISGELAACKKQITNLDKTVDLTDRHRPMKY